MKRRRLPDLSSPKIDMYVNGVTTGLYILLLALNWYLVTQGRDQWLSIMLDIVFGTFFAWRTRRAFKRLVKESEHLDSTDM